MIFSTSYSSEFSMVMRSRMWPRLCVGIFTCCLRLNAFMVLCKGHESASSRLSMNVEVPYCEYIIVF